MTGRHSTLKGFGFLFALLIFVTAVFPAAAQFESVSTNISAVENSSIASADFDGDGDNDVAIAGRAGVGSNLTAIYENDGNGVFTVFQEDMVGVSGGNADWGDYDGDGDLDLVVTGWDAMDNATATIYENQNNQNFTPVDAGIEGIVAGAGEWGDFDNDGDLDLAVVGTSDVLEPTATLYENEGNNQFSRVGARLRGVTDGSVKWSDVNQDSLLDLTITGKDRENFPIAVIYLNQGDGEFDQMETDLMGVFGDTSVDWEDYNNDGYPDVVITGWNANLEPTTVVYRNHEGDSLSAIDERFMGIVDGEARWVDYDQNDQFELFVSGMNANNTLVTRFYQYESDTSFARSEPENIKGLWRCSLNWSDFSGNTYPDLLMSGVNAKNEAIIYYFQNNGQGENGNNGNWLFE